MDQITSDIAFLYLKVFLVDSSLATMREAFFLWLAFLAEAIDNFKAIAVAAGWKQWRHDTMT